MDSDGRPGAERPGAERPGAERPGAGPPIDERQAGERQLAAEDQRLRAILDREIWPTVDQDDW